MKVTFVLDERLYEDDYETFFSLRSYVDDSDVSLGAPESEPSSKVQMLPHTVQMLDLVLRVLACLTPQEATGLLDRTRSHSSCLIKRSVWSEVLLQSCTPDPSDCLSSANAGTFAQASGEDGYGLTPTAQFSRISLLMNIIIFAGPFTSALPIPQTDCTLNNNTIQSKLGKRQSPECEIKHRSSLSVDTLGIPAYKRRCSSFASADAKPVPPVQELGAAGDIPNALEKDPILPVNKESSNMPHLDQWVINAGNGRLILDNFTEFLAVNSASWSLKETQGQHSLGIPLTKSMSYQSACAAYVKAWEAQPDANRQSPLARFYRRVIEICFVVFFQGLVQEVDEKDAAGTLSRPRHYRQNCTIARDLIITEIYGDITETQRGKYRQNFNEGILRWGSRWWKMGSSIGLGFVLFASEELAITMGKTNFTNDMVEDLINYIVNVYPGLVSLCEEFGPITQSLMLGKGFSSLLEKINKSTLSDRLTKAEQRVQDPPDAWKAVDLKLVSTSAANDFLRFRQEYFQKVSEAAGSLDNKMSNDTD